MTATATLPRPAHTTPAAASRTASSHAPRSGAGSGHAAAASFAQLLRAQDDPAPVAATAAAAGPQASAPQATEPEATPARPPDRDRDRDRERKPVADDSAVTPAAAAAPVDLPPTPPAGNNSWLLVVQGQADAPTTATAPSEGEPTSTDPLAALRDAMGHGLSTQRRHGAGGDRKAAPGGAEASDPMGTEAAVDADTRAQAAGFGQALAEASTEAATARTAPPRPTEVAAPAAEGALPSLGAVTDPARNLHMAAPAEAAPPTAQASLPASPGTPAFAPALGAQLSTWLKDGVQHASLELHPQDLGPIDVRIAVKDGQTRVDLAADVASTRQALVDALPQLSAALGDVGLSLAGGGVADPSAQGQPGHANHTEAGRSSARAGLRGTGQGDSTEAMGHAPATARQHRGLLDLYA